jgi:hypothetical protein
VTKRKKHTTNVGMIPGLLIGHEAPSRNERRGSDAASRTRVRLFRLKNGGEQAALYKLCLGVRNKRGFQRLVLAYLQLIADTVSLADDKKLDRTRPNVLKDLRRRVQSVRNFANRIESRPSAETSSDCLGIILPMPPVRELRCYADDLEELANRQRPVSRKQPPRHRPRPGTRLIVRLAEFVRRTKGSPCWVSLATLLFRSAGVRYNEASLKELVKFHKAKARRSRIYSRLWFPDGLC